MANRKTTPAFHVHMAQQFVESVSESANTIYYIMASKCTPFPDDRIPPEPTLAVNTIDYEIHNEMIFGKNVKPSDVSFMVRFVKWEEGKSYDMYDDKDPELHNKNFFVAVEESDSNYSIFKCLYNGVMKKNDSIFIPTVNDKPVSTETNAEDEYYRTSDGYVWKFMCYVPRAIYEKFSTENYIPIVEDAAVKRHAKSGAIEQILLEEVGSNYNGYAYGSVRQSSVAGNPKIFSLQTDDTLDILTFDINVSAGSFVEKLSGAYKKIFFKLRDGTTWFSGGAPVTGRLYSKNSSVIRVLLDNTLRLPSNVDTIYQTSNNLPTGSASASGRIASSRRDLIPSLSSNTDFYKNSSFYIRSGKGAGQLKTITEYIVTGNERRVLIDEAFAVTPDTTSRFEIGPRVIISGDGTGRGGVGDAKAIVNMDESSNTVHSIEMIDVGINYSWADVKIVSNTGMIDVQTGFTIQADDAAGRAIISPPGGHGSNIYDELQTKNVCVSTTFDSKTDNKITSSNDYRTVSILKDPYFDNLTLTLNNSSLLWAVGEKVVQDASGATGFVSGRQGTALTLSNIRGFFLTGEVIKSVRPSNNITDTINNLNKRFDTVDQRTHFAVNVTSLGPQGTGFLQDEVVVQEPQGATAYVQSIADERIDAVDVKGVWNSSDLASGTIAEIKGKTSGAVASVEGIVGADIKKYSGTLMSVENFAPIARLPNQTERVKIVLNF